MSNEIVSVLSLALVLCLLFVSDAKFLHDVSPSCPPDVDKCVFTWNIDYKETMIIYNSTSRFGVPIVYRNNELQKRINCEEFQLATEEELDDSITGDGSYRLLYTINGQYPGPSIVVYEGQQVVINVTNRLIMESVTIHWHGMVQMNTPWMDGVGMVSQCPVSPGQSFTYKFLAYPAGTHWYHSHEGSGRTDGLAGALIVLERTEPDDLPSVDNDFILLAQDWFHDSSVKTEEHFEWNLRRYPFGLNDDRCFDPADYTATDGGFPGFMMFVAGVINGRGHFYPDSGDVPEIASLPLETYIVQKDKIYRFRVINAANAIPLRISVDKHALGLVSTDGHPVLRKAFDFIVVSAGERVDFLIQTTQEPDNYWIRVEANGMGQVRGILRYDTAPITLPTSERKKCADGDICTAVNCLIKVFPPNYNIDCTSMAELHTTPTENRKFPVPRITPETDFQEIFMSVRLQTGTFIANINGKAFIRPISPLQTYPNVDDAIVSCNQTDLRCVTEVCFCTNIVKVKLNSVLQIVFASAGPHSGNAALGLQHPMHIHGNPFHVLKVGYPVYDANSGLAIKLNEDIQCDTEFCDKVSWTNSSWGGDEIEGLNLVDPPLKDTVVVPRQGYTVVRLRADNPGYWYMHCHLEIHQSRGMALILQVGDKEDMPQLPKNFPRCGDFLYQDQVSSSVNKLTSGLSKSSIRAEEDTLADVTGDEADVRSQTETTYLSIIFFLTACTVTLGVCAMWQNCGKDKLARLKASRSGYRYMDGSTSSLGKESSSSSSYFTFGK